MTQWTAFPHDAAGYTYDAAALKKNWARLHAGDAEPLPADAKVLAAWGMFHAGEFQKAAEAGLKAGGAGITVANKAQAIYANYLEKSEKTKLALFMEVAERAEAHIAADSKNANAHYFMAYALGRYSQGISIALGAFHAEVIDKVGSLLGRTQGASKDAGLAMFKTALKLNPTSAIAMVEYANGLVMLEGEKKMKEATKLYEEAAACEPKDAMERLDVEMAKAELED
jgi:tetratricopeptide (TPR) repeat protein